MSLRSPAHFLKMFNTFSLLIDAAVLNDRYPRMLRYSLALAALFSDLSKYRWRA